MIITILKKTPLYFIYQHLKKWVHNHISRKPNPDYRSLLLKTQSHSKFNTYATQLVKDGILILPSYFSPEKTQEFKTEFDTIISTHSIQPTTDKEIYINKLAQIHDTLPLKYFVSDPLLSNIAQYYWGQPCDIVSSFGYQIDPMPPKDFSSYQWHHDCKFKQLKVFVLLTDLEEDGQTLDYIPGTHTMTHVFTSYDESRFNSSTISQYGTPIKSTGKAGTVIFIDTNGLHRGNRNESYPRALWSNLIMPSHFSTRIRRQDTLNTDGYLSYSLSQK